MASQSNVLAWFDDLRSRVGKSAPDKAAGDLKALKAETDVNKKIQMCQAFLGTHSAFQEHCEDVQAILSAAQVKAQLMKPPADDLKALKAEPDVNKRIAMCETYLRTHHAFWEQCAEVDRIMKAAHVKSYLLKHPNEAAGGKAKEDMLAESMKERAVDRAKEAYAVQMKGETHAEYNPAKAAGDGNVHDMKQLIGHAKKGVDELKKDLTDHTGSGLVEGEVLAVRTYTARDYAYMNPAVANEKDKGLKDAAGKPKDWMDSNKKSDALKNLEKEAAEKREAAEKLEAEFAGGNISEDKRVALEQAEEKAKNAKVAADELLAKEEQAWPQKKRELYQEGALHAGMVMEAFKKMPKVPLTQTLYRGARMTKAKFEEDYRVNKEIPYASFCSMTTAESTAIKFANGTAKVTAADAVYSVIAEAHVAEAREITKLSLFQEDPEALSPPGTLLTVIAAEDDPSRQGEQYTGKDAETVPQAIVWKRVRLEQKF